MNRYLAGQLGRFASSFAGAQVSDFSPKSTSRENGAVLVRRIRLAHSSEKEKYS
jgi:hypothetical protein